MRLLIVSTKQRLAGYAEFVEALDSLEVEAICVHNLKYCSHACMHARIENSEADDTNSGSRLRDAYFLVLYIVVEMIFLYARAITR